MRRKLSCEQDASYVSISRLGCIYLNKQFFGKLIVWMARLGMFISSTLSKLLLIPSKHSGTACHS